MQEKDNHLNVLFLKSEPLDDSQLLSCENSNIQVHQLSLLQFEYGEFGHLIGITMNNQKVYDYLIFTSPNAIESLKQAGYSEVLRQKGKNILLVGNKTKNKFVSTFGQEYYHVSEFQNQLELAQHLNSINQDASLLYFLGNLSKVQDELIQSPKFKIDTCMTYRTINIIPEEFNKRMSKLKPLREIDFIVYFSGSNFEFFWSLYKNQVTLDIAENKQKQYSNSLKHIFFGKKSQDYALNLSLEVPGKNNFYCCINSKFEEIINILLTES